MISYQKPIVRSLPVLSSIFQSQYLDCNSTLTCNGSSAPLGASCIDGTPDQVFALFFLPGATSAPSSCSAEVNGSSAGCTIQGTSQPGDCPGGIGVALLCNSGVTCNGLGTDEVVVTCDGFQPDICRTASEKK